MTTRVCRFAAVLIGCAVLGASARAAATVVMAKDFNALCDEADMIFVGTVVAVESRWADVERQDIETLVTFSDISWIRGTARGALTLRFAGGSLDGIREEVAGVPQFRPGERRVIFALDGRYVSPIVGFDQGAFRVVEDGGGPHVVGAAELNDPHGALHLGTPPTVGTPVPVALDEFLDRVRQRLARKTPAP